LTGFQVTWAIKIQRAPALHVTHKNLTSCNKSANKPSTRCIRTTCHKLSTGLEQLVTTLSKLSDLLQGCSDKSVTCLI
jgi:hypothetical protein